jgi:hypothetical protein
MVALIRRGAVLAACVAAVALVYWGAGSAGTMAGETPCLDAAARAPTATPDASAASLPRLPVHDNEAQCRLRRALLATSDVPGDWNDDSDVEHLFGTEAADCGTALPAIEAGVTTSLFSDGGSGGNGLLQRVYAFRPGGAVDLMTALRRNCASIAERDEPPYSPLDLPTLGDESFGLRQTVSSSSDDGGTPFVIAYIRHADLVTIVMLATDSDPMAAVENVGQAAAEKLARVGPMPESTYVASEECGTPPSTPASVADALRGGLLTLDDMPIGSVEDPLGPCGFHQEEQL